MKMDRKLRASYRFCRDLARREARNFYFSFLLLPPESGGPCVRFTHS